MNHLLKFNESNILKDTYIHYLCKKYKIRDYILTKNGVNVLGEVSLAGFIFNELPIKFGRVTGHFSCNNCKLTNLNNSPRRIDGHFIASNNNLISFEGFPDHIGLGVSLLNNPIRSAKGFPEFFECTDHFTILLSKSAPIVEILNIFGEKRHIYNNEKDIQDFFSQGKSIFRILNFLNEYDVIQGDSVIQDRLEMALDQLGIKVPDSIELKNYKLI